MKKYHATILIVDDNANDRHLIEEAFRLIGITHRIQSVTDGIQAIEYMCGEGKFSDRKLYPYPTFIIIDLKMVRADGFAVLDHLKKNPEWAIIPTVVLSGSQDLDDIKKSYMLGASSYHVKPHSLADFCVQLKILHDYWLTCEVPEVDTSGRQLPTDGRGKLGERFGTTG